MVAVVEVVIVVPLPGDLVICCRDDSKSFVEAEKGMNISSESFNVHLEGQPVETIKKVQSQPSGLASLAVPASSSSP